MAGRGGTSSSHTSPLIQKLVVVVDGGHFELEKKAGFTLWNCSSRQAVEVERFSCQMPQGKQIA